MPIVATCRCGHGLSPEDDWIGSRVACPACGAEVTLPTAGQRAWWTWVSLALGALALGLYLAAQADLPDRLMPRTISRQIEQDRVDRVVLGSMAAALLGLLAGRAGLFSPVRFRSAGLLLCSMTLVLGLGRSCLDLRDTARHAARRVQCVNNLKQIALALANYEQTHGAYPPRMSRDAQGRPLLSWRVAILPYLEQGELYAKFHLDEPWDSPDNRPLADQVPSTYLCPSQANWSRDRTLYQVLDGPGMFLDPSRGTKAGEITDIPDRTIAVIEGNSPVLWTGPGDFDPRRDRPFPGRDTTHPGGFNASLVDGSVHFFKNTITARIWDALGTRAGGEVIQPQEF